MQRLCGAGEEASFASSRLRCAQEGRAVMSAMAARDAQTRAAAAAKNELEAYIIATAGALGSDALAQAQLPLSRTLLHARP